MYQAVLAIFYVTSFIILLFGLCLENCACSSVDRTRMPLNHAEMITAGTHLCKYVSLQENSCQNRIDFTFQFHVYFYFSCP